jgi:hypothetical protein
MYKYKELSLVESHYRDNKIRGENKFRMRGSLLATYKAMRSEWSAVCQLLKLCRWTLEGAEILAIDAPGIP